MTEAQVQWLRIYFEKDKSPQKQLAKLIKALGELEQPMRIAALHKARLLLIEHPQLAHKLLAPLKKVLKKVNQDAQTEQLLQFRLVPHQAS